MDQLWLKQKYEYQDKISPAIDVAYEAQDAEAILKTFAVDQISQKLAMPIWTTTPWTLPASQAISLNPELDYSLVKGHKDYVLILATELVNEVCDRYDIENPQILSTVKGEELKKFVFNHPFYKRDIYIVLGDHVTVEAGTGAVHSAPAHGVDDFNACKGLDIEIYNPVGANGVYLPRYTYFCRSAYLESK